MTGNGPDPPSWRTGSWKKRGRDQLFSRTISIRELLKPCRRR